MNENTYLLKFKSLGKEPRQVVGSAAKQTSSVFLESGACCFDSSLSLSFYDSATNFAL